MVIFILKSTACLAIFLMFYKLLLENERMHTFKRYYLLTALVLSLIIPSFTFVEYVEVTPAFTTFTIANTVPETEKVQMNYWPLLLWTVYGLGVLIFTLKFAFNLGKIARTIRNNPKLKIGSIVNVLLRSAVVPHTFFNYVFLNHKKFKNHEIPKDVLIHEAAHAEQKHSLDILFVELIHILFWFNPLLYYAKKSIKLNHEFLADEAVTRQGSSIVDYQNLLLDFASSANYSKHQPLLANAINYSSYSSIKKRLKIMKTKTSRKSILIRSLLLLPLFVIMLYGFSATEQIQVAPESTITLQTTATKKEVLKFNTLAEKYNAIPKEKRTIPIGDLKILENVFSKMTNQQKADAQSFPECPDSKSSNQEGATKKQIAAYNSLAKKYNTMLSSDANIRIKKSDVDRLGYLHGIMTEAQRAEAEPFPDFPEPPEPPIPPASPAQIDTSVKPVNPEKIIEEIVENQEIFFQDGNQYLTKPSVNEVPNSGGTLNYPNNSGNQEEHMTIHLNGKEISYLEMKKNGRGRYHCFYEHHQTA